MSHFTVLVPAQNESDLEARLLPYHEYECTGIEAYLEFVPEDMEQLQADFAERGEGKSFEEFVPDWCGAQRNEHGVWGHMTNPRAKWDWWTVGGRWQGTLVLKESGHKANSALAGEVDWNWMRQDHMNEKRRRYHAWKALPDPDKVGQEAYRKAVWDADLFMVDRSEVADLDAMTCDQYVEKYGKARALTFAYLDLQGQWQERGNMGWFAMVSDLQPDYDQNWWSFVESLPADQRLYVVDCHI